jgi:hypothetical protein
MRGSISLPTSRQRSTESIERGSARITSRAALKNPASAQQRMIRVNRWGSNMNKNDVMLNSYLRELPGPIETELLAAA